MLKPVTTLLSTLRAPPLRSAVAFSSTVAITSARRQLPAAAPLRSALKFGTVATAAAAATKGANDGSAACVFFDEPPSLLYFPVPGAPGEIIRLVLTLGGIEFNDQITGAKSSPSWPEIKPTAKFGKMPLLRTADGKELAESRALARYLARDIVVDSRSGATLYPQDAFQAFQVDEYVDAMEDARLNMAKTFMIKDPEEKVAARAALFAPGGAVFEALSRIDKCVAKDATSSAGCMVGNQLTLADVWAFAIINTFRAGFLDGIPTTGWLEELPALEAVVKKVETLKVVKDYYTKKAGSSKLFNPHAGL